MCDRDRKNKKSFYAIQFMEPPFEVIADYVCVPYSWILFRKETEVIERKVLVAYPEDEDPFVTRDRAKRREICSPLWMYYFAFIKYESNRYKDVEHWIAMNNKYGPCDVEELDSGDTQPQPVLNKKLRSSIQNPRSSAKTNKPQLTKKRYENPRKPMIRISIKRPIQPKPTGDLDNKRLKPDEAKLTRVIDYESMAPECSKKEQSITIRDNQLISYAQTMTGIAVSNSETSTGQRTLRKLTQENKSVVKSVQSTSSQLPCEKQPLPVCQDREQTLSMPVLDVVASNDVDGDQEVQRESREERPSFIQTTPNTLEPSSQPAPVNERPISLVRQESLPQEPRKTSAGQSNGINDTQQTQLHRILTEPTTVSEPPSTMNQLSQLHQRTRFQPVGENSYPKPQPRETGVGKSTEVSIDKQRKRSHGLMTTPSTSHHVPNLIRISSLLESTCRKPSSFRIKNPAEKKTRLENITRYISTAAQHSSNPSMQPTCSVNKQARPPSQNHLQVSREPVNNFRSHIGGNDIDPRLNNTSAAQNLSNLVYQSRFFVDQSHERQHLPPQADHLQQITPVQDLLRRPNVAPSINQTAYLRHSMMNEGFIRQSQGNSNQPSQFLPGPENPFLPIDRDHLQQVLRHKVLGGFTERTHTVHKLNSQNVGINIPFAAQNSSFVPNQSHHNVEYLQQRQNPPNYQKPQRGPPTTEIQYGPSFNSKSNNEMPEPQRVIMRTTPSALLNISSPTRSSNGENYLLRDPRIQARLKQSSNEYRSNLAAAPQNITVEPVPTMKDSEVQTTSSDPSHETQFVVVPENQVYQHPRTKKLVVDQSTATDFNMDCDETVKLPVIESSPRVVDSGCQTDYLPEELLSPCQEVASDHEAFTDHEIVSDQEECSDNEMTTDDPPVDINNKINCTEESPLRNNTDKMMTVQNTSENQQVHPRIVAEQQMLNVFADLFTQMGAHMSYTCDMFNTLRNSIVESAKTYQTLLETVQAFNSMETFQISPSSNVTAEVPQETEEIPAGETERSNSGNGENINSVSAAPEKARTRYTFVLPPEYDPNDSKWTLKYKKKMPGLVELMPRSGIYVNSLELKRCKRESKDCKMLARLLLTEVFSKNALSVCSLTGGKAKAFKTVDIDVRPGLDAHARMVLLAYVEQHGLKRKWFTSDTQAIISSIRSKVQEMRARYGQSVRY